MAIERPQFGQPLGPTMPTTLGRPLAAPPRPPMRPPGPPGRPPTMPPGMPGAPPGMPPGPPGAPPGAPAGPPLPDPRQLQREAIIEALGGPQVVPDTGTREPEGPSTVPRAFWPQDATRRAGR